MTNSIQDFSIVTGEEFRSGFGDEQGSLLKDIDNYLVFSYGSKSNRIERMKKWP